MSFLDSTILSFARKPWGSSAHSTFPSPQQTHTARGAAPLGRDFSAFSSLKLLKSTLTAPPRPPRRRAARGTAHPTQATGPSEPRVIKATDEELNPKEKHQMPREPLPQEIKNVGPPASLFLRRPARSRPSLRAGEARRSPVG